MVEFHMLAGSFNICLKRMTGSCSVETGIWAFSLGKTGDKESEGV